MITSQMGFRLPKHISVAKLKGFFLTTIAESLKWIVRPLGFVYTQGVLARVKTDEMY